MWIKLSETLESEDEADSDPFLLDVEQTTRHRWPSLLRLSFIVAGLLLASVFVILLSCVLFVVFWLTSGRLGKFWGCFWSLLSFLSMLALYGGVFAAFKRNRNRRRCKQFFAWSLATFVVFFFVIQTGLVICVDPTSSIFSDSHGNVRGSSEDVLSSPAYESCGYKSKLNAAKLWYGNCVDWSQVKIVSGGFPRWEWSPWRGRAMAVGWTVMLPRWCDSTATLVHELFHSIIMSRNQCLYGAHGVENIVRHFFGQLHPTEYYNYTDAALTGFAQNLSFVDAFNVEQLAMLMEDFFCYSEKACWPIYFSPQTKELNTSVFHYATAMLQCKN